MYAVIAVFGSLSMRGRSRYTADFDNEIYVPAVRRFGCQNLQCIVIAHACLMNQKLQ